MTAAATAARRGEVGRAVVIDHLPERAARYGRGWVVVAVDVFRATTTACTAVAAGHRCFPAESPDAGRALAARLPDSLLAGEQHGDPIPGFETGNSPAALARRTDRHRPVVLVTSSGTRLLHAARGAELCFAACLRNVTAQVKAVARLGLPVAVIGAGTRGERRAEDELACARIGAGLLAAGFVTDRETAERVAAWGAVPIGVCARGPSADYLRRTGQEDDIAFVIAHDDDLDVAFHLVDGELLVAP